MEGVAPFTNHTTLVLPAPWRSHVLRRALVASAGFGFHGKCAAMSCFDIKRHFEGPIIANIGYTRDTADGAIRGGSVDMVGSLAS